MVKRKPQIALVVNAISGGGAELVISNLCRHINANRFNISVCYLKERGERGEELLSQGYNVFGLPNMDKKGSSYLAAIKLRQLVMQRKVDLFHTHDMGALFDCALCKLISPRVKLIHTFHFGNYPNLPLRYLLMEKVFSYFADRLIAVGDNQKYLISATYRLKENRIETVHNGIILPEEAPSFFPNKSLSTKEAIVIGSICTFTHQKGLDYFLEIAKAMKKQKQRIVFWAIGDGPLRTQLEKQKNMMGLDETVKFFGWIPKAAETILPMFDIFLQTSRWEAMSMVILEAMAARKPIIATDVGDNRKIIESAGAGFIVQAGDVRSSVEHLENLLAMPDLRVKMGAAGERFVRQRHSVKTMAQEYESLYAMVLKI